MSTRHERANDCVMERLIDLDVKTSDDKDFDECSTNVSNREDAAEDSLLPTFFPSPSFYSCQVSFHVLYRSVKDIPRVTELVM